MSTLAKPNFFRINFALAIAYFVFWFFCSRISSGQLIVPILFIPEGIALAVGLFFGWQACFGVFVGELAIGLFLDAGYVGAVGIALVNASELMLAVYLSKLLDIDTRMNRFKDFGKLVILIFFILQPYSSIASNAIIWAQGAPFTFASFWNSAVIWWSGNALSQALLTPALLTLFFNPVKKIDSVFSHFFGLVLLPTGVFVLFLSGMNDVTTLITLLLPLVIFIAYRESFAIFSFSAAMSAIIAGAMTSYGYGPFSQFSVKSFSQLNLLFFGTFIPAQIICLLFKQLQTEYKQVSDLTRESLTLKLELASQRTLDTEARLSITTSELSKQAQQLRYVLDVTGDGIWDWNISTGEVKHNSRWVRMLAENPAQQYYSVDDFKHLIHPDDLNSVLEQLCSTLAGKSAYRCRYRMIRHDGRQIWVEDKGAVVERSLEGTPIRMVGAISDITEEVVNQEKVQELIFFDDLTKLPNRKYIQDRIQRVLRESEHHQTFSGLMYLDLDDFKIINDTYGHHIGDVLLKELGSRIQKVIRPTDIIARIGGDEYSILFEQVGSSIEASNKVLEEAVERIFQCLTEVFELGNHIFVQVRVSIGVVVFGSDSISFDELHKFADIAMYAAKNDPIVHYRFFSRDLQNEFERKNEIILGLKDAYKHEQFVVAYQPVVNGDQECIAYEALARWNHPQLGTIMPDDFIPFAESCGLMNEVGYAILKYIFASISQSISSGKFGHFDLMINVSTHQLINLGFKDQILLLSERYQFPLNRIHLEVTEGAFLTNTDLAIDMMKPLQEKGVKFVLDDFGTGYSSLAYLQKLPIEYLKIDKSFVRFMTTNGDDLAIVENILSLAKSLGLRTVAEGVETKEQFDLLLAKGCDYFQGWYFGRPSEHLGLPSNFSTPLYS